MPIQILLSWSGGKDSALALYEMQRSRECEIASLLTTITRDYDRISMHGVRRVLLEEQAQSLGYSLEQVFISNACVNEEYENTMRAVLTKYQAQGVSSVVFGDLFLEEIRKYREEKLAQVNMRAIFP
jgi:diphthamide synthase (EF-2-diphthine--ammonia ligase)